MGNVADTKNYYEILGVDRGASVKEIKKSYHELARLYHPDSNFYADIIDDKLNAKQIELFKVITCAYQTLIDPQKREKYDSSIMPTVKVENKEWDESDHEDFWSKKSNTLKANNSVSETKNLRKRTATFGQTGTKPFRASLHDGELKAMKSGTVNLESVVRSKNNKKLYNKKIQPVIFGLFLGIICSVLLLLGISESQQQDVNTAVVEQNQISNNQVSDSWKKNLDN